MGLEPPFPGPCVLLKVQTLDLRQHLGAFLTLKVHRLDPRRHFERYVRGGECQNSTRQLKLGMTGSKASIFQPSACAS